MAGYIVLGKYTEEGLARLKEMPEIIRKHKVRREQMGIRMVGTWLTMGEYDFISVYDAPDEQTMMRSLLMTGMAGLVRTLTLRAFGEDEFAQILAKMP
ncbi:MAG: GYD domain-containing protein [Chloroflexota bacterium]